jgi:flagellar biosynthesis/type III secretory pathway ATPase
MIWYALALITSRLREITEWLDKLLPNEARLAVIVNQSGRKARRRFQ